MGEAFTFYILLPLYIFYLTYYARGLTPKRRRIIAFLAPIWTGIVVNAISCIPRQVSISTKGQFIYDPSRKQQHKTRNKQRSDINFSLLSQIPITIPHPPSPCTTPSFLVYLCLSQCAHEKSFNQKISMYKEKEDTMEILI